MANGTSTSSLCWLALLWCSLFGELDTDHPVLLYILHDNTIGSYHNYLPFNVIPTNALRHNYMPEDNYLPSSGG